MAVKEMKLSGVMLKNDNSFVNPTAEISTNHHDLVLKTNTNTTSINELLLRIESLERAYMELLLMGKSEDSKP